MFSIRRYPCRRYFDGHVDIFDMVDIDLFSISVLNMMVVQLGYTGESGPLYYNYLRPLTSLDEGLYALACEEDVRCLATLVRSFNLIEVYIEHGVTAVDSYRRPPPHVRATIEDITEPGSSAAIKQTSEKMLLLTWHESSAPTKEHVCDSITPSSLPQHDSSTPCKDPVCKSVTPRCMPNCMLTPPTDESVITYTQLSGVIEDVMRQLSFKETELDGEVWFGDVAGSGIDSSGLSHDESFGVDDLDLNLNEPLDLNVSQTETQSELPVFEVLVSEEPNVGRTQEPIVEEVIVEDYVSFGEDVEHGNGTDDDFLVDEENEIVKPDVDVHLFGISMDVPFDNINVTNLVPNDVLEGEGVDVINPDGFDSDPGNDNQTSKYRRIRQKFTTAKEAKDRVYLHSIESRRNLKLYKNDSVRVRARCDGKVPIFTMSQDAHDKGGLCRWVLDYVAELQSTNPNTSVKIAVERNTDPSLPTRVFQRIYVCLGALKLGFRACKRELIGLDCAFMKGQYPCQYLGDDIDLQPNSNLTFINDRQKGIIPGIKIMFPSVEHRFCLQHIHEKIKQGWCRQAYKDLLWRSASATSVKEFEKCGNNVETNGLSAVDGQGGAGVGVGSQVTETRNANGREISDGKPTQSSIIGGASEIMVMIRKRLQKTKTTSYKAKSMMPVEDDMGWYTDEMRNRHKILMMD
ncbi:hypothetical protein Tco_0109229 [Tanacetum coccineum]